MVVDLILLKNRNFSAHEISCHFLLESAFALILFADVQYTNCTGLHILLGFLEFHKFALFTDCYTLFCF